MATSKIKLPRRAVADFLELASVARQVQKWTEEAVELGRSMEAFGVALREDASQIDFRGDLMFLAPDPKSSQLQLATVISQESEI